MSDYKNCPNCGNVGFYVVPNHYTGEPEMEQCRFCYEETDSIFNTIQTLTEALAAKEKELGDSVWCVVDGEGFITGNQYPTQQEAESRSRVMNAHGITGSSYEVVEFKPVLTTEQERKDNE